MIRITIVRLCVVASVTLAGLLMYIGWQKYADPGAFRVALDGHDIFPKAWIGIIVSGMPWIEIALGFLSLVFLLDRRSRQRGALVLIAVFSALLIYLAVLWARPPAVPVGCGCGLSKAPVTHWFPLVLRNAGFLTPPLLLAILHQTARCDDTNPAPTPPPT